MQHATVRRRRIRKTRGCFDQTTSNTMKCSNDPSDISEGILKMVIPALTRRQYELRCVLLLVKSDLFGPSLIQVVAIYSSRHY